MSIRPQRAPLRLHVVASSALVIAVLVSGCGPSLPSARSAAAPSPTHPPTGPAETRVRPAKTTLAAGEAVELIAEGRLGAAGAWDEIGAIWTSEPGDRGVVQVPAVQSGGRSRVTFLARSAGSVKIVAEPVAAGVPRAEVSLEIAAAPTPSATAVPAPAVKPASPPGRTAAPAPAVEDSPELRGAITRLDQLDRAVLAVADTYVGAFRAYGSGVATEAQLCESVADSRPRHNKAAAELRAFAPPAELRSIHREYVGVADGLGKGLGGLVEFCRTSDRRLIKAYADEVAGAIARSAMAKSELDRIATSIGMPIPRSTRSAAATPTQPR